MPNTSQIEHWDGPGGEHWASQAARYDRMTTRFADKIIEAVRPRPGEMFLDVGCGNGALSLAVAPLVAPVGKVTGLDISRPMLAVAKRRAQEIGSDNVSFVRGDAQISDLPSETFDAVVSRFGVMFFDDPIAAFSNLVRMLKPGGRLAFACWRELLHNEWLLVPAGAALQHVPMPDLGAPGAPGPFSLADPERVREILSAAGVSEIALEEVVVPMSMGSSIDDALAFMRTTDMATTLMGGVDAVTADKAWDAIRAALDSHSTEAGVQLNGSAWLVTASKR